MARTKIVGRMNSRRTYLQERVVPKKEVGRVAAVSWGFVLPRSRLYSLLEVFRKLAGQAAGQDSESDDPDPSESTDEGEQPPAKKAKLDQIGDSELDELLEYMVAAREKADESREDSVFYLRAITCLMRVSDQQAGDTIACYYSGPRVGEGQYRLKQTKNAFESNSLCMGRTLSLEQKMKDIPKETSEVLRKVFHFKEAGIEVQDQWLLTSTPICSAESYFSMPGLVSFP